MWKADLSSSYVNDVSIRDLSKSPNLTANLFPNCRKGAWHALVGILMPEESFRCWMPRTILFTWVQNHCTNWRISIKTITDMLLNLAWSDLAIGRLLFRVNWRMAGAYSFWIFIVIFDFFADKNLFRKIQFLKSFWNWGFWHFAISLVWMRRKGQDIMVD